MPLNKIQLKQDITAAFNAAKGKTDNPAQAIDTLCNEITNAIDNYIRNATVTTTVTGAAVVGGVAGTITGTGQGSII